MNFPEIRLSRRTFIETCVAAAASRAIVAEAPAKRFLHIGFIKPIQKLPYAEIARIARHLGWDGIECPVRRGGTMEPEQVEDELPRLVEALKKEQIQLSVIATNITDANDPVAAKVLRTAKGLGIERYRTGYLHYNLTKPIPEQLETFRAKLKELARLNKEVGIQGGLQNHSGKNYFGAPVWDFWEILREINPKELGIYFDVGHAQVEGGVSWGIQAKLVEPHLVTVSVKDFVWKKSGENWRHEWCPLGEGVVKRDYFDRLMASHFTGPICHHIEYRLGEGEEKIAAMKRESDVLKRWLREAGA